MSLYKLIPKPISCIIICILTNFVFVNVLADENKQNGTNNNQVSSEKNNKTVKPNIGKRSRVKTLEEFIPSEEVSADKPVAFPSDI